MSSVRMTRMLDKIAHQVFRRMIVILDIGVFLAQNLLSESAKKGDCK